MTNIKQLQSMTLEELVDWLDKYGSYDDSPWTNWFNDNYCSKCESVECPCEESLEKLGIEPLYDDSVECAYCELAKNCRFFPELKDTPDNKEVIRMWLTSEVEYNGNM